MDYINIIGLAAAAMGGISLLPQLIKVLKNQIYQRHFSWNDFNIFGQHIFVASLWTFVEKFALIIANFFGFIQALIILLYKIKYIK